MTFHCSNRHQQSSESAYGSRQHMQNHWAEDGEGCLCHVLQGRRLCQVPRSCERLAAPSPAWWKEGQALGPECRGKGRGYGTADVAPWAHPAGIRICVLPHVPPTPHTLPGLQLGILPCVLLLLPGGAAALGRWLECFTRLSTSQNWSFMQPVY